MLLMNICHASLLSLLLLLPRGQASPLGPQQPEVPQLPIAASPESSSSSLPLESSSPSPSNLLLPRDPDPQSTCLPNSGTDNTGCNNSGVSNSGTGNSGICLSGTNESGVGDCSVSAEAVATSVYVVASPTTVYLVQTVTLAGNMVVTTVQSVYAVGATATQTIVVDDGRYNRPGCAYWRTQGYVCSDAGERAVERLILWPVLVGVVAVIAIL